jgi:hypothetical protein
VISFRYHVVSLAAVLLALAAGIVLGGGPLQGPVAADDGDPGREALAATQEKVAALEKELAYADAYAASTAGRLVRGTLGGRTVTLLELPGAEKDAVSRAVGMVEEAGGTVTARAVVTEELLDVANRQLVGTLAAQLQESAAGEVDVPAGASGYERMGLLIGHAVATSRAPGRRVDEAGDSILAGLATAELMTTQGDVDRRGSLVLLVAGEPAGSADTREGAGSIVASLVAALDESSDGVVLAGPPAAAAGDGVVTAVREDPAAAGQVSTVDVVDTPAGAVAAVLALAREAAGRSGHYGAGSAPDGPLPDGSLR